MSDEIKVKKVNVLKAYEDANKYPNQENSYVIKMLFPEAFEEEKYPCKDCGILRTKDEGGTTFTVCDDCWDKKYKKHFVKEIEPTIEKLAEDFCNTEKESELDRILRECHTCTDGGVEVTKKRIISLAKKKVDECKDECGFCNNNVKQKLNEM
jgi:hypothetical protein